MRRKLIQIGKSTLLLSAPREWVKQNNLSKGDEVEVDADNDKLTIWCDSRAKKDRLVLDVTEFKDSLGRFLFSMYRRGIDEIELRSKDPAFLNRMKSVIWGEAVGFEIVDQGEGYCRIVNVSGKIEDFNSLLRRLFHVTLTMGNESLDALKKNDGLENVLYLEHENNKLASMLMRAINKYGSFGFQKTGPLYFIVQELERIGDQYKYMAQFFIKKRGKILLGDDVLKLFEESSATLRQVYELFYTFHPEKPQKLREMRNKLVEKILKQFAKKPSGAEIIILQHSLNIATRSFDLIMSIMVLRV